MFTNITDQTLSSLMEASFKDFHAKGLDYICLKRTPQATLKVYFFDGDVSKLSEVVNPHDHRYKFNTGVLAGSLLDKVYLPHPEGEVFQAFDYMTPLNGGGGFTFRNEERLSLVDREVVHAGDYTVRLPNQIHTIKPLQDQTILMLVQFEDVTPIDVPTSTWVRQGEPTPNTSGLYSKFTTDEFLARLKIIEGLSRG